MKLLSKSYLFVVFILLVLSHSFLKSEVKIDSLLKALPKSTGNTKTNLLMLIAQEYTKQKVDSSIYYAQMAIVQAQKVGDKEDIAIAQLRLAFSYYYAAKYDSAITYYNISLKYLEQTGDKERAAAAYNDLGIIYKNQSKFDKSLQAHIKALKLRESAGLEDELSSSYNNIGNVYYQLGNHEKALENYEKSLDIKERLGLKDRLSTSYNNIGMILYELKDFQKALKYYKKSMDLDKQFNNLRGVALTLNNIANVYAELGNLKKSEEYSLEAMRLDFELKNMQSYSVDAINLGYTYMDMKKYNKAIDFVSIAEKVAIDEDYINILKEAYLAKYHIYKNMGNYQNALQYFEKYNQVNDSLFNATKMKQIEELKIQFETDNKNKEIEILKKEKEIISKEKTIEQFWTRVLIVTIFVLIIVAFIVYLQYRAIKKSKKLVEEKNLEVNEKKEKLEEAMEELKQSRESILEDARKLYLLNERIAKSEQHLKATNATKDKFFSIIAHDLKNPLTALMTSADLISVYFDKFDKENIKKNLFRLSEIAKQLRSLLDNLLQWSRAQTGNIEYLPESILLKEVITSGIAVNISSAEQKNIKINTEFDDKIEVFADKNMFNTIIRNLVSNALKFSYQGSEVTIKAKHIGDMVEISVKDLGVGLTQENIAKLFRIDTQFTSKGTNDEKGTGLGLILCKEFVDYHNGRIWVESINGEGSTFTFTIPIKTN